MLTQIKALTRMEDQTRRAMRSLEDGFVDHLKSKWKDTLTNIQARIITHYRADFGRADWDLVSAHSRGTLDRINRDATAILTDFHDYGQRFIAAALKDVYDSEKLRALWMIDQTTPASFKPKNPFKTREAYNPRDAKATWEQAFATWIDTYRVNLQNNLRMEALHEGSIHDAADEPAATKIDNFDPAYKFASMMSSEAIRAEADARREIFDANDDVVEEEVWVTMEDGVVCEICEEYDGLPLTEIDDDIPAHYNCRCYTRFVPKPWADMLSSADPDEKDIALRMDDAGLVPGSMAVRSGISGNLVGRAIVDFDEWKDQNAGIVRR